MSINHGTEPAIIYTKFEESYFEMKLFDEIVHKWQSKHIVISYTKF